jgi:hypothetical protein
LHRSTGSFNQLLSNRWTILTVPADAGFDKNQRTHGPFIGPA